VLSKALHWMGVSFELYTQRKQNQQNYIWLLFPQSTSIGWTRQRSGVRHKTYFHNWLS